MKSHTYNKPLFTIGMLINQLDGIYQSPLWQGVAHVAEEKNVNLLFFTGKSLNSPFYDENFQNIVYGAANPDRLDGLIVASAALSCFIDMDLFLDFLKPFRTIPIVSVSLPIDGIPSILVDGKPGMKKVIDHLIEVHGHREIAFIKGPEGQPESIERFQAYIESLESHNIPFNKDLIYQGNFISQSGEAAINEWIKKRNLKPDAIVASNDEMAMGAYKALVKMGFRIPQDIAVTGFDNIDHTQFMSPPCTSVKNPVYETAQKAAETLLDILHGKKVPMQIRLSSQAVFRQSCGCNPDSAILNIDQSTVKSNKAPAAIDSSHIIRNLNLPEQNQTYYETLFKSLIDALVTDLANGGNTRNYLNLFEIIINQFDFENENINNWKENLTILKDSILKDIENKNDLILAELIIDKGWILFYEAIIHKDSKSSLDKNYALWRLRDILRDISSIVTVDKLTKVIEDSFPRAGIRSCYITQFMSADPARNTGEKRSIPPQSRLLTGFNDYHFFSQYPQQYIFPTTEIIPDEIAPSLRRYTMVVMPLLRHSELLGLFIAEIGPKMDMIYGILREQISNALVCCELFHNIEMADSRLKSTLIELQKSEERFREMAMFLPTIIIETDLKLDLTFLNKAGFELFGVEAQKLLINKNLTDFVHENDREALRQSCSKIIYGELPNLGNIRLINAEGHDINLVSKASLIQRDSRIEGIRWSAIDIKPLVTSAFVPDHTFFENYQLSKREVDIINLVLQGYKNTEIAERLYISENTVKYHTSNIYYKMKVKNKSEFFEFIKSYQIGRFGHSSYLFSILSQMIKE